MREQLAALRGSLGLTEQVVHTHRVINKRRVYVVDNVCAGAALTKRDGWIDKTSPSRPPSDRVTNCMQVFAHAQRGARDHFKRVVFERPQRGLQF